ncbi:NeuD/PglB/VioB family sugar acetyltransferase [Haloplanus litoreus]|uniref:NeuD/PglB/VioB family sugar acetyltransferase n=1 Tax=Haloplanus litoreus TaxID=767515 RepID=A0ABD5ZY89_9EURY
MKVIYCAGELGRVVLDILQRRRTDEDVVFADDDPELKGTSIDGRDVIGGVSELDRLDKAEAGVIVAFADRQTVRLELTDAVREMGFDLFSAVDADSSVATTATIGDGVILNAQAYVGPGATISEAVVIDSAASVSHDVTLEEGVTVGPNTTIAGGVTVGRDAFVGAGATVRDDVTIGTGAVVGAGAVVTSSVPPETTVVGVPASPIDE